MIPFQLIIRFQILFLLIFSCRVSDNSINKNCIAELDSAIRLDWKYDSTTKYIVAGKKFITELDSEYFKCLIGKDTAFIIKKFGPGYEVTNDISPKIRIQDKLFHAISYRIFPCNRSLCKKVQFNFDENGIIRRYGSAYESMKVIE